MLSRVMTQQDMELYGESLSLLDGAIREFESLMELKQAYHKLKTGHDPIAGYHSRIKSAESMREKLLRNGLNATCENALTAVHDAAGVRIICPFVEDIYTASGMIKVIPGIEILEEKDYIMHPKHSGYRSYHMIIDLPLRFTDARVLMEIQIRTIAMDAWASIEHQLKYKKNIGDQAIMVSELRRCADEIASADLSLQTLRELINPEV